MVSSIIKKSELEGALRLDAEFYCVSCQMNGNFVLGKDTVEFVQYGTSKELNEGEKGFPVLRLNEFDEFFITTPEKYCGKISKEIFEDLKLKTGDVLICRTNGNPKFVGKSAVVLEDTQIAFASYLFRVRSKKEVISSETLVTFLNSKIGRAQIERFLMPSIQSNFSPAQFRAIKIPVLPKEIQKEIDNSVQKSYLLKNESSSFYSQAENLLLEELGLKDFSEKAELWSIVNLSETKKVNRIDAEYFQVKFKNLIDRAVGKIEMENLKNIFDFKRGVFIDTNYYREEKTPIPYIRIKELASQGSIDESKIMFIDKEYPENKNNELKENDIVMAIIGDTIGKTNRINKSLAGGYCSNNTGRLRIREEWVGKIIPDYTELLFQSIFIQSQIEQKKAQTGQPKINDKEIKSINIPILPKPIQQKISKLIQKSHESRKKAKELLEEAKHKVEELIESDQR